MIKVSFTIIYINGLLAGHVLDAECKFPDAESALEYFLSFWDSWRFTEVRHSVISGADYVVYSCPKVNYV